MERWGESGADGSGEVVERVELTARGGVGGEVGGERS